MFMSLQYFKCILCEYGRAERKMCYEVDKINWYVTTYGVCSWEGVKIFLLGQLHCFGFILCLEGDFMCTYLKSVVLKIVCEKRSL